MKDLNKAFDKQQKFPYSSSNSSNSSESSESSDSKTPLPKFIPPSVPENVPTPADIAKEWQSR